MSKSKSIKKILIIASLFISLGMFFVFANTVFGADEAKPIMYKAQIGFGAFSKEIKIDGDSIGLYITEIYKYAVGVVGILATIVMMWGGVLYITSGGDKGKAGEGLKWIEGAVTGLVLVMTSYMILYFVNPDLVRFKSIDIKKIEAVDSISSKDCASQTTYDRCTAIAGCEWQATKCVSTVSTAKCGLSAGDLGGADVNCCQNSDSSEYKYARIALNIRCADICGSGWSQNDLSVCKTKLGY